MEELSLWLLEDQRRILEKIMKGQRRIMADLTALEAQLDEVKNSAEVASAAVLAALAFASEQLAALQAQIDALVAGAVTQEQIDALTATAADADSVIDQIAYSVSTPG